MGLILRGRHRCNVWSWRLRYWWMDTHAGQQAHIAVLCLAALVVVGQMVHLGIAALHPAPVTEQHSVIWWVVYLIVMLVAAAVSYAMRPKAENTKPTEQSGPTTEDGQSVMRFWGTHWIDDEFLLAWKIVGRDPIKASGGK
ncbi:hypothetical protein PY254_10655 [Rhodanobacter sp. AS-Z3]|jgi:hypothetical protein|uniref:hypothetical protein n=1 Tax=Rhodanobacter sp. AS-Z3 TaxID=3031330 RepID=UPI002478A5A4|nr:hypothetical protein [Rhodanobacter sp. AS-Z3]WEN13706.1 hypothetical protein PY254_10655 [Rhodanobacter sp. AS-Z3]